MLSGATVLLLLSVATVSSVAYVRQAKLKQEAQLALEQANHRLAENYLQRGLSFGEAGNIAEGLLWQTRALQVTDANDSSLQRVVRLNLQMWSAQLRTLHCSIQLQRKALAVGFAPDGSSIVTVDSRQAVCRWDSETGLPLESFVLESTDLNCASLSGDGTRPRNRHR